MRVAVPALVSRSVAQAKIRPQIDEWNPVIEDRARALLALPMRQRGEDEVHVRKRAVLELLDDEAWKGPREVRMDGAERLPCPVVPEQLRGRERGMHGEKPQQLAADIARGSKDGRPNHGAALSTHLHIYAS
jgi:hypothetical protein